LAVEQIGFRSPAHADWLTSIGALDNRYDIDSIRLDSVSELDYGNNVFGWRRINGSAESTGQTRLPRQTPSCGPYDMRVANALHESSKNTEQAGLDLGRLAAQRERSRDRLDR
jgi:hypothetical protein